MSRSHWLFGLWLALVPILLALFLGLIGFEEPKPYQVCKKHNDVTICTNEYGYPPK